VGWRSRCGMVVRHGDYFPWNVASTCSWRQEALRGSWVQWNIYIEQYSIWDSQNEPDKLRAIGDVLSATSTPTEPGRQLQINRDLKSSCEIYLHPGCPDARSLTRLYLSYLAIRIRTEKSVTELIDLEGDNNPSLHEKRAAVPFESVHTEA
jgi:hypothetical protein